jgi:hypothetical protein
VVAQDEPEGLERFGDPFPQADYQYVANVDTGTLDVLRGPR